MSVFQKLLRFLGLLKKKTPAPVPDVPPTPQTRVIVFTVTDNKGAPLPNVSVRVDAVPAPFVKLTNDAGVAEFTVSADLVDSHMHMTKDGYYGIDAHIDPDQQQVYTAILVPVKVTPEARVDGRIRRAGRFFMNDKGIFRICGVSGLTLLSKTQAEVEAFVDWAAENGFNLIRVFAGDLTWAGQTAASARKNLPFLLSYAESKGIYVEVTAVTDSAAGKYDIEQHVSAVASICRAHVNTILEIANETFHSTQDARIHDVQYLVSLAKKYGHGLCVALGAPHTDEPAAGHPIADYLTLHLDRGRDKWNQVRRVRELEMASHHMDCPVVNNEPMGADERDGRETGKQRINDPAFFFTMGVLNRIFEVGGIHHAQHGLMGELPGPVQQVCAESYVRGFNLAGTNAQLKFKNAGWVDSPVKSANFDNVIRVYSGVSGNRGICCVLGIKADPQIEMQNGWRLGRLLDEMTGVKVYELIQS